MKTEIDCYDACNHGECDTCKENPEAEDIIARCHIAVLRAALGICALSEGELLDRLEDLYLGGFKAGNEYGTPECTPFDSSISDRTLPEPFTRETRYFVFKKSDITNNEEQIFEDMMRQINRRRVQLGKDVLKCAVVEADWPEYEMVWQSVENRVNGGSYGTPEHTPFPGIECKPDGTEYVLEAGKYPTRSGSSAAEVKNLIDLGFSANRDLNSDAE